MQTAKVKGVVDPEISVKLHEVPLHVADSRSLFGPCFMKKE